MRFPMEGNEAGSVDVEISNRDIFIGHCKYQLAPVNLPFGCFCFERYASYYSRTRWNSLAMLTSGHDTVTSCHIPRPVPVASIQ
jgi:hypothetical protein